MYTLSQHGDILEKEYTDFIRRHMPNYEKVWQMYIGNKGNDTKADIPNYPADRNEARQRFSECTYTILQAVILMKRLSESQFSIRETPSVDEMLTIHERILLFFTYFGRIRDNAAAASVCLGVPKNISKKQLEEFWYQRQFPVHGRILPILIRKDGVVEMPVFPTSDADTDGWNYKSHNWADVVRIGTKEISEIFQTRFAEILPVINDIFGLFVNAISAELRKGGYTLKFEYNQYTDGETPTPTSIYGVSGEYDSSTGEANLATGKSDTTGRHGSSGYAGTAGTSGTSEPQ